jgi:hypothetical protein
MSLKNIKSTLFNVPNVKITSLFLLTFKKYFQNFGSFSRALVNKYSLQLNSSFKDTTVTNIIIYYVCMYCSFDSSFIRFVSTNSQILSCPTWHYILLDKVCRDVESKSESGGWVSGSVSTDNNFTECITFLKDLTDDELVSILKDTPFSGFIVSTRNKLNFINTFRNSINSIHLQLENGDENLILLETIRSFEASFYHPSQTPDFFVGHVGSPVSTQFSVHRFRNSYRSDLIYNSSFSSLTSVSEATVDVFASFLFLTTPTIHNDNHVQDRPVPGDVELSLEGVSGIDVWTKIFSHGPVHLENRNSETTESLSGNGRRRFSTSTKPVAGLSSLNLSGNYVVLSNGLAFYSNIPKLGYILSKGSVVPINEPYVR